MSLVKQETKLEQEGGSRLGNLGTWRWFRHFESDKMDHVKRYNNFKYVSGFIPYLPPIDNCKCIRVNHGFNPWIWVKNWMIWWDKHRNSELEKPWCGVETPSHSEHDRKKGGFLFIGLGSDDLNMGRFGGFHQAFEWWISWGSKNYPKWWFNGICLGVSWLSWDFS